MKAIQLYKQLIRAIASNSPVRQTQKSRFIESHMKKLATQESPISAKQSQMEYIAKYSAHGVMSTLFRMNDYPIELRQMALTEVNKSSLAQEVEMGLTSSNFMVAQYFSDSGHPKMALLYNRNEGASNAKVITYADYDELRQTLKEAEISESFKLFNTNEIDSPKLITIVKNLSMNNNEFINTIMQNMNYNISPVAVELQLNINLENELDKLLKNPLSDKKIQTAILDQINRDGNLEAYVKERINNYSVLSDDAQQRLMLLSEQQYENIKITKLDTPAIAPVTMPMINDQPTVQQTQPLPVNISNEQIANTTNLEAKTIEPQQSVESEIINEQVIASELQNNADTTLINDQAESNEITPSKFRPDLKELRQEYDTLFRKVVVGEGENQQHYYETTDKSVKIHEQKVSVSKISQDSVGLALKAAVQTYGNELEIKGTKEFKEIALNILSQEKYKDVQLNNPDLQDRLNKLRGITPIENSISPIVVNMPEQQVDIPEKSLETKIEASDTPSLENKSPDSVLQNNEDAKLVTNHVVDIAPSPKEPELENKDLTSNEPEQQPPIIQTEPHGITVSAEPEQVLNQQVTVDSQWRPENDVNLFDLLQAREDNAISIEEFIKGVDKCSNLNQINYDKLNPLLEALSLDMTTEAKILIEKGIDVTYIDPQCLGNAIDFAVNLSNDMLQTCSLLIEAGCPLLKHEYSQLMRLASGADLQSQSHISTEERLEVCKLLIENGADINAVRRDSSQSVLMYAAEKNNYELINLIADKVDNINLQDKSGKTALHYISPGSDSFETADALLKHNADPSILDFNYREPEVMNSIRIAQHFEQESQEKTTMSIK